MNKLNIYWCKKFKICTFWEYIVLLTLSTGRSLIWQVTCATWTWHQLNNWWCCCCWCSINLNNSNKVPDMQWTPLVTSDVWLDLTMAQLDTICESGGGLGQMRSNYGHNFIKIVLLLQAEVTQYYVGRLTSYFLNWYGNRNIFHNSQFIKLSGFWKVNDVLTTIFLPQNPMTTWTKSPWWSATPCPFSLISLTPCCCLSVRSG